MDATNNDENLRPLSGERRYAQSCLSRDFRDVRARGTQKQAPLQYFDFQFRVYHDYLAEGFDGFAAKADAALRRFGVPGSKAPPQRLPRNQRWARQVADPPCRPGVEVERQRRLLEGPHGPQIERHRRGNELLKEVF